MHAWLLFMLISCEDTNRSMWDEKPSSIRHQSVPETTIPCESILYGDKDGFGMGMQSGDFLYLAGGTPLPIDHRSNDLPFTDVYPADISAQGICTHVITYTIQFPIPKNLATASLWFNTLGIQDGDWQVYNSDTDIKLYLDGIEVPHAFDQVDQFDNFEGVWADFVSLVEVPVPDDLLPAFRDGTVEVRWEIHQLAPGSASYDAFAIDYMEVRFCGASRQ